MCGIAGYINKSGKFETSMERVKKMTDTMTHRGPDAEGQWTDERVALGHRRLSIIDLDAKSNQPMISHDGRYVITFNGEIYNYIELKKELLEKGMTFRTDSDTEVIIEAYRAYGEDCFNMFNGMWSFVLYDREQQKLIFCRDRFGIKPFYTVENEDVFAFASEMKAIIAAFPEENIPNEVWIYRYLSYARPAECDEECIYKNIKIFPPAHYMVYRLEEHSTEYKRYWKVDEQVFYSKWIEGKNPIKTFKTLFESAVELRLRADVEVGACLSGGLDSSSIVGCASKKYGKRLHTFSSIYEDEDCNEEIYIREVNKRWGTVSHYIEPDNYEQDFEEYIKKANYIRDQPTGDVSTFSAYMVMRGAYGKVRVVLDGQGADELFAGYSDYPAYYIRDLLEKNTIRSKREALKIITAHRKIYPPIISLISTDMLVGLVGIKNSFIYREDRRGIKPPKLFTNEFLEKVDDPYSKKDKQFSSHLNTRLYYDLVTGRLPEILRSGDGEAMAFSLESREPFMDYRIVEFALALNAEYKIKNQWSKWLIRKACREYLPRKVAKRKNKMGFPAPFARWLRGGKSKDMVAEVIYAFGDRNIILKETIDFYYKAHMNEKADYNGILFRIYSMELWMRMHERQGV